ncbi:MAG: hypothetical protein KF716_13445 [Anaerolineae bacterium]|nr:hypothetical protein [Anaerolineae bacterium]
MSLIVLRGHVNEAGQIILETPINLPPGEEVEIVVEQITPEAEAADNARWDELLSRAESIRVLEEWGAQALADDEAGLTEDLDPDTL